MKKVSVLLLVIILVFAISINVFAHSGRTDASGGHKDNRNASGLGSYHYHHGYGPHLHANGICPYSTSSSSSSASSGSNSATTSPQSDSTSSSSTTQSHSQSNLTVAEKEIISKAENLIQQAKSEGNHSAILTLTEENELTLAVMQEIFRIAKESDISIKLNNDTKEDSKIILRLEIDPSLATKKITLGGHINNEQSKSIKNQYQSWYDNQVEVIALNQQDNFGMVVEIIAKIDLSNLETNSLLFYSYNQENNAHIQISSDDCHLDANGYVHIRTSLAGYIIITDEKWVAK